MKKNYFPLVFSMLFSALSYSVYGQYNEIAKLLASDLQAGDHYSSGRHGVSVYGDYALVGAKAADYSGYTAAGAVYVYKRDNDCNWSEIQKLTPNSPVNYGNFGFSVSMYRNFIVVGAPGEGRDENGSNFLNKAGAVYIFQNVGGTWIQVQKLVASDREFGANFGNDCDITRGKLIVGAYQDKRGPGLLPVIGSGSAYIFKNNGLSWSEAQKLVASERGFQDYFGFSVSITYKYAIVGAPGESEDANENNTLSDAGSAYIFESSGGIWNQIEKITSSDRGINEEFGISVEIDGARAIVGAYKDGQDENGNNTLSDAGSAFIFSRSSSSVGWFLEVKLDADDRGNSDRFGTSVGISNNKAIVGAYQESEDANDMSSLNDAGSAYIYELSGSTWSQVQKIVNSDRAQGDHFGASTAIHDDRIIVGAFLKDRTDPTIGSLLVNAGAAYIFSSANGGTPPTQPTIFASNTNFCPGSSITLSIDSGHLNGAADWEWYVGSCNGVSIGTGNSITVNPNSVTTYFVNGTGGCAVSGACGSVTLTPNSNSWHQTTKNTIGGEDVTRDVITDEAGNVYVTGSFRQETTLNGGNNSDLTMLGAQIASYVAKYNPCGDLLWESHAFESKDNQGNSITLDENNEIVYVAGNLVSNLRFISSNSCGISPVIHAPGITQGYVASFRASDGCIISLNRVVEEEYTTANAIAINQDNGDIFVGGQTSNHLNAIPYTSYVHKYNPNGTSGIGPIISDITSTGDDHSNKVNDMDYDEIYKRLWVIGNFDEKVTFSPGLGTLTVKVPGNIKQDAYLLAYGDNSTSFAPYIIRRGNTNLFMSGEGIALDPRTGNPYFTGTFSREVSRPFQFSTINDLPDFNYANAYMIGLDINTMNGWSRYGNVEGANAFGKSVTTFKDDRVIFVGNYQRSEIRLDNIGNFPYVTASAPLSNNHIFMACYRFNGSGDWGNVTIDPSSNSAVHNAHSITTNRNGDAFIVGDYLEKMDYLNTSSSSALSSSGNGYNGFILRANVFSGDLFRSNDNVKAKSFETPGNENGLLIFPNPSNGEVNLKIKNYNYLKTYELKIQDLAGKVVYVSSPNLSSFSIDLSELKNGMYIINLSDGDSVVYDKVMKQ